MRSRRAGAVRRPAPHLARRHPKSPPPPVRLLGPGLVHRRHALRKRCGPTVAEGTELLGRSRLHRPARRQTQPLPERIGGGAEVQRMHHLPQRLRPIGSEPDPRRPAGPGGGSRRRPPAGMTAGLPGCHSGRVRSSHGHSSDPSCTCRTAGVTECSCPGRATTAGRPGRRRGRRPGGRPGRRRSMRWTAAARAVDGGGQNGVGGGGQNGGRGRRPERGRGRRPRPSSSRAAARVQRSGRCRERKVRPGASAGLPSARPRTGGSVEVSKPNRSKGEAEALAECSGAGLFGGPVLYQAGVAPVFGQGAQAGGSAGGADALFGAAAVEGPGRGSGAGADEAAGGDGGHDEVAGAAEAQVDAVAAARAGAAGEGAGEFEVAGPAAGAAAARCSRRGPVTRDCSPLRRWAPARYSSRSRPSRVRSRVAGGRRGGHRAREAWTGAVPCRRRRPGRGRSAGGGGAGGGGAGRGGPGPRSAPRRGGSCAGPPVLPRTRGCQRYRSESASDRSASLWFHLP